MITEINIRPLVDVIMIAVKKKFFYSFKNFTNNDKPETSIIEINFYNKTNFTNYISYKEMIDFNGPL